MASPVAAPTSRPSLARHRQAGHLSRPRLMLAPVRKSIAARAAMPNKTGRLGGSGGRAPDGELSAWTSIRQERWEGELELEGVLPQWLEGTYLRNGPGLWNLGDHGFWHLFDGYATLVRVAFRDGRVVGAHRQVDSDAYKAARAHGEVRHREFSEVPEQGSPVSRLARLAGLALWSPITDNANTGVLALGDGRVICTSEAVSNWILVDPDTLHTVGKSYTDKLGGLVHSAHPIVTTDRS